MHSIAAFERARIARDPRFDGQFFVGVKTTGIYCRPICPANSPKRENIRFYPTAAAASEAGFRPCLRCRPECAPGTPAWHGTSTTVRRGLRLIAAGALDGGNVEQLAERLGVTSRHLRRLFSKHLGASPLAVAHTQRLHFAKRLIDQTDLPLGEIADAAGYGSVRRFNDAFRSTYGRAPRELRRRGRDDQPVVDTTLAVKLAFCQPFDWPNMLEFMRGRAIPGVESVADGAYWRTIRVNDRPGVISVRQSPATAALVLTVHGVSTTDLFVVVQKVRELFDLDAPVADIRRVLGRDATLKRCLRDNPGIRVPGTWDGFELIVRAILGQQVSVKAATTLSGRIAARYGEPLDADLAAQFSGVGLTHLFPGARRLMRARLNNLGITGARVETIRRVARSTFDADLNFDTAQDPDAFCDALTSIRGIGDWTAQYVSMRALKNPDAFPGSDLGLLRAFDAPGNERLKPAMLSAMAEDWRPWRAYAALLLWNSTANSGG